jgi:methylmalonyl-CoA mutase cobalamin-binding subunit
LKGGTKPAGELIAQGRAAAPVRLGSTAFLRSHGVGSEAEYKQRCRDSGRVMFHMHVGLSTWEATAAALCEVHEGMAREGHTVDRFGVALDRAMGVPEEQRHLTVKETGPRIAVHEWPMLGEAAPIQPHLGDYMIGLPAGFQNTLRALGAGVSTIGNVGQYTAYDLLGGSDEILVTEETVRALAALAALRTQGALAHSNLEDGSGTQARHFGGYVGWAALELYVVEELIGARLAHCFGNTIQNPESRAVVHFALDDLRNRDSIGSMIYGNTVDSRPGTTLAARARNTAALSAQVMCDIALQLRRPTGHAVNPVPLTEADRIPNAAEIVEVHLLARELEREVRKAPDFYDWNRLEALGAEVAAYAVEFRNRALSVLDRDGVDTTDAAQMLLALRRTTMPELERRIDFAASPAVAALEPWKAKEVRLLSERLNRGALRLDGKRVVLAVLEVHDLVRDALAFSLPAAGAEVILLGANTPVDGLVRAAVNEDADAIVLGVYNGNALAIGERLMAGLRSSKWDGHVFIGGILNQDTGEALPVDARPGLDALGIHCVERAEDLIALLAV